MCGTCDLNKGLDNKKRMEWMWRDAYPCYSMNDSIEEKVSSAFNSHRRIGPAQIPRILRGKSSSDDPSGSGVEGSSKNANVISGTLIFHSFLESFQTNSGERRPMYPFFDILDRKYTDAGDKTDQL